MAHDVPSAITRRGHFSEDRRYLRARLAAVGGTVRAERAGMRKRVWAWLAASTGCVVLIAGCGGSARDVTHEATAGNASSSLGGQNAGAVGGSGNAGAGTSGAGNGAGVPSQGGAPGASICRGDFDEVAAIWADCPRTLCAGLAWAKSCDAIRQGPTTAVGICGGLNVITLDLGVHGKACYYAGGAFPSGEPKLVGASAWDDTTDFCKGTSFEIVTGSVPTDCNTNQFEMICDGTNDAQNGGAGGEAGAGGGDTAGPPGCYNFNAFSSSCEPCCPTATPDCTGKPDGYPGYSCTPSANSSCSCSCGAGNWSCGC